MSSPSVAAGVSATRARVEEGAASGAVFFLYCYFLIDYFVRFSARIPGYGVARPTLLLAGILFIAMLSQGERLKAAFRQPPVQAVLLLVLYVLFSLPLVEWPGSVLRNNLSNFIKATAFIFFTATFVDTDRRLRTVVALFVGLQAFRVLEPLYLYWSTGSLSGYTYVAGEFQGRLNGAPADVVNANGLGFVIVTTLGFMHFLLIGSRSKIIKLIYLFGLLPLFLYAMELTASRGAFITFIVLLFFMLRESRHKAVFIVLGILLAIGGWAQMSDFNRDRYLSLVGASDTQESSVEGRLDLIMEEFRLGMYRPIVGHGVGTTSEAKVNELGLTRQASHNLYGELLIETGSIGFIIFMVFLWRIYRLVRGNLRALRRSGELGFSVDNFHFRLNQALLAVFFMYAVYSLNYYGLSQEYWYLFGGLCVAFSRSIERSRLRQSDGFGMGLAGAH